MEKLLQRVQEPQIDLRFSLLVLFILIFIAYLSQAVFQAFNADDVIQAQYPSDALTFLAQGRWGYYFVYAKLQNALPAPVVSTFVGACLLLATAFLGAILLDFKRQYQLFFFAVIASISLYYGKVFSFDSTRIAYPLGNLIAVWGLYAVIRGDRLLAMSGLLSLSMAPAFYPASTELAATLFMALFLVSLATDFTYVSVQRLTLGAGALIASLIFYLLITKGIYLLAGWHMGSRTDMDFLAIFSRYPEVACLFTEHALPFLSNDRCATGQQSHFERISLAIVVLSFNGIYLVRYWRRSQFAYMTLFLLGQILLLLAPFILIFASKSSVFPDRSLYSIPYIYAFYLVMLLNELLQYKRRAFNVAALLVMALGAGWVMKAMIDISNKSFGDYLDSQRNLHAVNRVISDIESVLAAEGRGADSYVPMVVINEKPRLGGAMHIPWSRERIYRLLDPRFDAAVDAERARVLESLGDRPVWPAEGSVYVNQDTLVVILSR